MENLIKKLNHIQNELKVPKDHTAGSQNRVLYVYRSVEDIYEKVKPLLKEAGLMLTLKDEIVEIGNRVYVKAIATITDGTNSIEAVAYSREPERANMSEAQLTGSCSSYARKYALGGLFLLDDSKDIDEISQSPAVQKVAKQVNSNLALTNAKKAFMNEVVRLGIAKEQVADFVAYYGLSGNTNTADWQNAIKNDLSEAVNAFLGVAND